jgi:predicted AlkP superfamily pyrophosphatase or phosphodiesterase
MTNYFDNSDVDVHAFQHYSIINSGLSEMFMGSAVRHPIATASDMWISIRELLESETSSRKYIWAYWGQLDGTSHLYGPDSERARAEFFTFSRAFETHFLSNLDPKIKNDTLVILTADHGQISTDPDNSHYNIENHPDFTKLLHLLPTGENRLAYLHVKPGQIESVKNYINSVWPGDFEVFNVEPFIQAGLFGSGKENPTIHDRLGDLIVAAKGNAYWWWGAKPNPLIGRHGGFSYQEMLVPFLAGYL